ncbi:MAG: type II secretion system protein [Candidatus Absconditabacterales bacterium]
MKKIKGFTLIELIIVMVIIGILSVILLKTYTWISQMTFRVQQTKNVQQEVLRLSQVMQNFADRNTIDFSQYSDLTAMQGLTDTLYLDGEDGTLKFFASGDCNQVMTSGQLIMHGSCVLMLQQSGVMIQLTDPHKVVLGHIVFKIIPFASPDAYLQSGTVCDNNDYLHCVHKPGFRLLLDAYSINYGTQWATHVHIPLQLFY